MKYALRTRPHGEGFLAVPGWLATEKGEVISFDTIEDAQSEADRLNARRGMVWIVACEYPDKKKERS